MLLIPNPANMRANSETVMYIPKKPYPVVPRSTAMALFRTAPKPITIAADPPIRADDFRISP